MCLKQCVQTIIWPPIQQQWITRRFSYTALLIMHKFPEFRHIPSRYTPPYEILRIKVTERFLINAPGVFLVENCSSVIFPSPYRSNTLQRNMISYLAYFIMFTTVYKFLHIIRYYIYLVLHLRVLPAHVPISKL